MQTALTTDDTNDTSQNNEQNDNETTNVRVSREVVYDQLEYANNE